MPQRRHHVDLHIAVEQDIESVEPPAQRSRNQRALSAPERNLRDRGERSGGHRRLDSISFFLYLERSERTLQFERSTLERNLLPALLRNAHWTVSGLGGDCCPLLLLEVLRLAVFLRVSVPLW